MIVLILFGLPTLLYGIYGITCWRACYRAARQGAPYASAPSAWPGWLALALHGVSLTWPWHAGAFFLGFAKVLSATLWLGGLLLAWESRRGSMQVMRLAVLPPTMLALVLPWWFPGSNVAALARQPWFAPHLVAGMLAYGVLGLAALHAAWMQWMDRDLHHPGGRGGALWRALMRQLPPLMRMERILFQLIGLGFSLLLLTTVSGLVFAEQVFGRALRWEHKTVLGLLALLFFGVLLSGRVLWGWRGRLASQLTLWGFVVLMLAYVGTHFVLEVLLHRV